MCPPLLCPCLLIVAGTQRHWCLNRSHEALMQSLDAFVRLRVRRDGNDAFERLAHVTLLAEKLQVVWVIRWPINVVDFNAGPSAENAETGRPIHYLASLVCTQFTRLSVVAASGDMSKAYLDSKLYIILNYSAICRTAAHVAHEFCLLFTSNRTVQPWLAKTNQLLVALHAADGGR